MRLLLAEDEKDLSHALVTILKHNNYSVDAVYNGVDALAYLQSQEYDGAVLDIMMPGMDGITVLQKIRAEGNTVPVLMLTAKSEINDRVLGLDSGADDYLGKPFAMKELLARIRSVTRRQSSGSQIVMDFGNISLNKKTFELSSADGSCRLANKEFQMLELLMMNPGQLISTDRFMEKIWGLDSEAEINVVWVYISYLRKKLAAVGAKVQIKAARNQGYSLEEQS
ncbi:MAG: response regulator transcription factor [Clostridia bacterium]|nr:response regulator transcription factor [Clostridia bacterium]NCC43782.1 response regulator transcription factor [Clostridia bacterium]